MLVWKALKKYYDDDNRQKKTCFLIDKAVPLV